MVRRAADDSETTQSLEQRGSIRVRDRVRMGLGVDYRLERGG
jgi:hypothetical protein